MRLPPTLRGWLVVVCGGRDALVGRLVDAVDEAAALACEEALRDELLAGRTPTTSLAPVYTFGSVVFNVGAPGQPAPMGVEIMQRLERTLGFTSARAVPAVHTTLTAFQFAADYDLAGRRQIWKKIEEAERALQDLRRGLVPLDS